MTALFFDTETNPLEHSDVAPRCVVAAIAVGDGPVALYSPEGARSVVADWVRRGLPVVGHALAFDMAALGLPFPANAYDTQIRGVMAGAAAGKHEAASSGLADLARPLGIKLTGKGSVQLSFRQGVELTAEQEAYAREDVVATRAVWQAQGGPARAPDELRQTAVSADVWKMARLGVCLDVPRVQAMLGEARAAVASHRPALLEAGILQARGPKKDLWRDSAVDRPEVQRRLRESGATRPANETSAFLASDEEALRASGDPALATLADYKAAEKWAALVEAFDVGPVARARWKPMVASGRIACAGPNLTQVPKGLRQCVVPSEGNVLVVADYSQLEFRVWADTCMRWLGWSVAAEALCEGRDVHTEVARLTGGDRQGAKAANYGFVGGMGPKRAAATYGMTEPQAFALRKAWRRAWPEWRPYFQRIEAAREGEFHRVRLPWSGRERLAYYSEAANFLIQGGGSDIAKEALRRATAAGLPVTMLIHDEFVLDCPRAQAEEAGRELARCMEAAGREVCPSVPWAQDVDTRERW